MTELERLKEYIDEHDIPYYAKYNKEDKEYQIFIMFDAGDIEIVCSGSLDLCRGWLAGYNVGWHEGYSEVV